MGMENIALYSGQWKIILEIALKSNKCFSSIVDSV